MAGDLGRLVTESRLSESMEIDVADAATIVRMINEQDKLVASAVEQELPKIARAIDLIAERLRKGGRLFYVGAGTSGRLGVMDASEIPPTFGSSPTLVQGLIAGGREAVFATREGAEDSTLMGTEEIAARCLADDAVIGLAASGRTPYTIAALQEARRIGCATVALTNNPHSPLSAVADVAIAPLVGPEVIMGSTRMKAGTAQKMVLNMISTGVMIKLGKVYTNLMVDMQATNEKLRLRATRMVMLAAGVDEPTAATAMESCNNNTKTAIVSLLGGVDAEAARQALTAEDGFARKAIARVRSR